MTVLEELKFLDMEIAAKQDILQEYRDAMDRVTRSLSPTGGCKGGEKRSMEITVIRAVDLEREIQEDMAKLEEKKKYALDIFNRLEDPRVRTVMIKRYLQGKKFEAIEVEMHMSRAQIYKLHKIGCREFEVHSAQCTVHSGGG